MYTQSKKGFTLIELLVVIAIIGILSSVVIVSLNTARSKARDATRKSNLQAISTAISLYSSDQSPESAPTMMTTVANANVSGLVASGCNLSTNSGASVDGWTITSTVVGCPDLYSQGTNVNAPRFNTYAKALPRDVSNHVYGYINTVTNVTDFCLGAEEENTNTIAGNTFKCTSAGCAESATAVTFGSAWTAATCVEG